MQFIALILIAIFLNCGGVVAQDRSYDGTIRIEPVRLEQLGETLHVDLDIVMEDVNVKSAHGVDFIPQFPLLSPMIFRVSPLRGETSIWSMSVGWQ